MAFTPLVNSERDQLALHIDDIAAIIRVGEGGAGVSAAFVGERGLKWFEEKAGGYPGTNRQIGVEEGDTLSIPERNQMAAACNTLTGLVEHDGANAHDVANEILALLEENSLQIPETGRDVTQAQLP